MQTPLRATLVSLAALFIQLASTGIASAQAITEGFDDITTLPAAGWVIQNNSTPVGTTTWFQGGATFPAQAGANNAYIAANFNSATGANTISNWLITPNRTYRNGDTVRFFTRTVTASPFPDRLQVRLSSNGASTNVGTGPTGVGDFTTLLLDINPTYAVGGYPEIYTQFTITLSGLSGSTSGRIAFRYFVENGGPGGSNSNFIGIDTFSYTPAPLTPPGAPTIGSAIRGNSQATISFTPPASNGGSPITGYTATCNPGPFGAIGPASPLTVTGLTNGTTYTCTVTATNAIGTSAPSASVNVTPATVPGAPVIGAATPGNAQASIAFSAPASNGGSPITGYTVTCNPGALSVGGAASPLTVTALANGTVYTCSVTATNAVGTSAPSATVNVTPVTVPGAPIIGAATPGNAQVTIAFSAPASNGGSPITGYTATCNPGALSAGAGASPLTVAALTNGTVYTCSVTATNAVGTSAPSATVNVTPATVPGAPAIGAATPGNAQASIAFSAPASNGGSPITSYTVTCNPGAFSASGAASPLTVTGLTNGTTYTCSATASNAVGTSAPSASVNVTLSAVTATRLINLSTRGQVQTGDNVMIGGFIVGGSSSKTVLIRAVGPNLANFGVQGVLSNPTMQLFSGQTVIASNDDWQSNTNAAAIQATGLAPANALESAILVTLAPGPYTAIVSGVGGGTGVGIIEVFEMDNPTIPLINISTRGQVQSGDNVMIGGFIIQGSASQTVLIRAVGPNLANFGVPGVLANPTLQLFSGQTVIASNDDWQSASNAAAIQATGLAPANALESAILITLAPGAYTAIVSGVGGATGVGIVEVFAQ